MAYDLQHRVCCIMVTLQYTTLFLACDLQHTVHDMTVIVYNVLQSMYFGTYYAWHTYSQSVPDYFKQSLSGNDPCHAP